MKRVSLILGVVVALLGALWLLQGLGVVRIQPILCVANCDVVQGPSATWAIAGGLMLIAGCLAIVWGLRGRSARPQ